MQALAAYTERHYKRIEELADDSYLVEWVLNEMDGGVGLGGLMDLTIKSDNDPNGDLEEHEKDVIMLEA
jgi:U3 small nucleolar RNA-associated protein 13